MKSRYDYMRSSTVLDIDGEYYPDPLTVNYDRAIEVIPNYIPRGYTLNTPDLKKLWVKFYKETSETSTDDMVYSINGIEHVGVLEPGDNILLYNTDDVRQYEFKDLA